MYFCIIGINVFFFLLSTGTMKNFDLSFFSLPPKTHLPYTCHPHCTFSFQILIHQSQLLLLCVYSCYVFLIYIGLKTRGLWSTNPAVLNLFWMNITASGVGKSKARWKLISEPMKYMSCNILDGFKD